MTLEKLSRMHFKVWTSYGYKDLDRKQLNEKIQLKLFGHRSFSWESDKTKRINCAGPLAIFAYAGAITCVSSNYGGFQSSKSYFENHGNIEIDIEDILDYDDGGL